MTSGLKRKGGEAEKIKAPKLRAMHAVVIHQSDTVKLVVFVVNGDEHVVRVTDPTGVK